MTIEQALHITFTAIGAVLAIGGGGAAVSYGLFRWFGRAWLDQHFKKRFEELKHEQQKEIEQLRHQINSLYSRISKIHEKEFEILPQAWKLLNESYGAVFQAVSSFKQFPDLNGMSEPQFEEFLSNCALPSFARDELRHAEDRIQYYAKITREIGLSDARTARISLNNYLAVNSIFMTQSLRQQFKEINQALAEVLINEEIGTQSRSPELQKSAAEILGRVPDMFENIESAVQKRLRYEEA
jgi:hypothetical protein